MSLPEVHIPVPLLSLASETTQSRYVSLDATSMESLPEVLDDATGETSHIPDHLPSALLSMMRAGLCCNTLSAAVLHDLCSLIRDMLRPCLSGPQSIVSGLEKTQEGHTGQDLSALC